VRAISGGKKLSGDKTSCCAIFVFFSTCFNSQFFLRLQHGHTSLCRGVWYFGELSVGRRRLLQHWWYKVPVLQTFWYHLMSAGKGTIISTNPNQEMGSKLKKSRIFDSQDIYPRPHVSFIPTTTYIDESRHAYGWTMSHIWMNHATHMNQSCYTHLWIMPTHINKSCPFLKCPSHICRNINGNFEYTYRNFWVHIWKSSLPKAKFVRAPTPLRTPPTQKAHGPFVLVFSACKWKCWNTYFGNAPYSS